MAKSWLILLEEPLSNTLALSPKGLGSSCDSRETPTLPQRTRKVWGTRLVCAWWERLEAFIVLRVDAGSLDFTDRSLRERFCSARDDSAKAMTVHNDDRAKPGSSLFRLTFC
jgi:hypothetical protein